MDWWEAMLLGAVEGFTEFLPISSTGHLTILEKLLGYSIDDPDITAFTAIIQAGAVLATVIFLRTRHRPNRRRPGCAGCSAARPSGATRTTGSAGR